MITDHRPLGTGPAAETSRTRETNPLAPRAQLAAERLSTAPAATGRGLAASTAQLVAHLQQPASPAPHKAPVEEPAPAPARVAATLDGEGVRAAVLRCTWALSDPGHWFPPDVSDEILAGALSAVRKEDGIPCKECATKSRASPSRRIAK
ncbi:hypothetical protein ACFY8B_32795 [Streptomyces sp. NPDC012751]|uniref:hypothetical protein n=1 Tax=Streptomyces sp. NPDC012751 TaxID=3364846 RepID=UPI0036B9EB18